jgi:ABC-2 type transport system ATP-binding protein
LTSILKVDSIVVLEVRNLRKTFGPIVAVDNLSFRVDEGSIHGLVGPNGSGKTTTFKSIVGLTIPDSGEILIEGENLLGRHGHRLRGKIGYSPETIAMPSWLSVREFLYITARLDGLNKKDALQSVEDAIKKFNLDGFVNTKISSLSKGQKKRVLIAQALIPEKKLYVLDEPMTGLDPEWVIKVREFIREKAKQGSSVIVSSHLLRELETIIDSVTVIKYGVVLFSGSKEQLASTISHIGTRVSVEVDNEREALQILRESGFECTGSGKGKIDILVKSKDDIDKVVRTLIESGIRVYQVSQAETSLEDAYVRLLKR